MTDAAACPGSGAERAPPDTGTYARVGETFSRTVTLDPAAVSAFARSVGDSNPLHHDPLRAAQSRFGGLIACGPHTSSLLLAVTADEFSARGAPLGLDFRVKFRRAVPADATLTLSWTVTRVARHPTLDGDLVSLDGRATGADGTLYLSAEGLVLVRASW